MRRSRSLVATMLFVALIMVFFVPSALAQEAPNGEEIFQTNCAVCHGADGTGNPGVFPPLVNNPNVADADHVRSVIRNGLEGEIEVNGVTYNGVMPAIGANFSDAEVDALVDYVQNQLGKAPETPAGGTPPPAEEGRNFPWGLVFILSAAVIAAAGVVIIVAGAPVERFTWGSAYLRGLVIFLYFFLATVWLPSSMYGEAPLDKAPKFVQELVISGAWGTMLVIGLLGLRWLQRTRRI